MKLIELLPADQELYNRFVQNCPSGSFLQSWEWGQWQASLGREVYRYKITDVGGKIAFAMQIIKMPLPLGKYYLYVPYGPVLAKGEDFQFPISNFQLILRELQQKFAAAVFIRVEPKVHLPELCQLGKKSINIQPGKTLVVNLEKSEEELLLQMHQKTRYNIKLAQRHGVEIISDLAVVPGHGLYVKEVLDMIVQTSGRQNFQTFPRNYYQNLLDFFALHNEKSTVKLYIYKALLNRQLLSAALMVDFGNVRTYLFGGSSEHHREVMAPHLLHFTAMKDAKKNNLKLYDFWGVETASGETPGFVRFKFGFAPQNELELPDGPIKQYPGAYDVFKNKILYHSYHALRKINRVLVYFLRSS